MDVIDALMDRCLNLVTESEETTLEEEHVTDALGKCDYPGWSTNKGLVVELYVEAVSESGKCTKGIQENIYIYNNDSSQHP